VSVESQSGGGLIEAWVDRVTVDATEPSTHDLVVAAIRVARGAGLPWGHIARVLAGDRSHPPAR
jgi:hypothetical protein